MNYSKIKLNIFSLNPFSFLFFSGASVLFMDGRETCLCCCFSLQPLSWQQPYVPVLARGMLDFLMVPTAFLMGCHLSHYEEVATVSHGPVVVLACRMYVCVHHIDMHERREWTVSAACCILRGLDASVGQETDDLVLVNIDNGSVSTSCSDTLHLPEIPPAAADCFTQRFWHFFSTARI